VIAKVKKAISIEDLCSGIPKEFQIILKYARTLAFEERPDYLFMLKLLEEKFSQLGYEHDLIYDWMLYKHEKLDINILPITDKPHNLAARESQSDDSY